MKSTKRLIIFIAIILVLGMWIGINIGQNKPIFSNPFSKKTALQKTVEKGTKQIIKEAKDNIGDGLNEAAQKIKDKKTN